MPSVSRVRFRNVVLSVALVSSALLACSSSDEGAPAEENFPPFTGDCSAVASVPTFAQLQSGILPICLGCHSASLTGPARNNAPEGLDFETYELVSAVADSAVLMVQNSVMPPAGRPVPTESQKNQFYAWAACGKPR